MNYLKHLQASEPVRLYLYGLMAPVLALLVAKGVISNSDVMLYTALGTVVLLGPATELTRRAVVSPATHNETVQAVAESVTEQLLDSPIEFELEDPYQGRHYSK